MRYRAVAVLFRLQCGARGARASLVRPMRPPVPRAVPSCRDCPPDPVTSARAPFLFAVRPDARSTASSSRDGAMWPGPSPRRCSACDDRAARRCHHVGAPGASTARRARIRPSPGARRRARTANGDPGRALAPPRAIDGSPGPAERRRAPGGDAGRVRCDARRRRQRSSSSMTSSRPARPRRLRPGALPRPAPARSTS